MRILRGIFRRETNMDFYEVEEKKKKKKITPDLGIINKKIMRIKENNFRA
ncbi:MAG: hypothetical protein Pars2KO_33480 [Parasphingorhabdus sp.]